MKTAGIIGGLGPKTTADFYVNINNFADITKQTTKPSCIIINVPLPFSIEAQLLLKANNLDEYLPYLQDTARQLESAGADFVVIPCNTVHGLIDQIKSVVSVPVLSIIEETQKVLETNGVSKALLLATSSTIQSGLYESNSIEWLLPNQADQTQLNEVINRLVQGEILDADRKLVEGLITSSGQQNVVLACSDIHILISEVPGHTIFDTMKILADATSRKTYGLES